MIISRADIDTMQSRFRATLINSISGFKSLNLVGTRGLNGISNLAPFNSIVHIGSNPPYIGMIARPETDEHQTLRNIRETGYYTLNHVNEEIYEKSHQTSAKYDALTSEFKACGLTEELSSIKYAPYVLESNLTMLLKLKEIIPIELNGTSLVIGEVMEIKIRDGEIDGDGFVHIDQLGSITSSGVDAYYKVIPLKRMPYAKV